MRNVHQSVISEHTSVFGFFIRAANGQNSPQFRCKNTHVALLHSVFYASLVQILTHFRLRTKNPNTLLRTSDFIFE